MKKNLTSQFIALFISVIILFILVLIPLVNNNLTSIIDKEMYSTLEYAQQNYIMGIFNPQTIESKRQCFHVYVTYDETTGYSFKAEKPLDFHRVKEISYIIVDDLAYQKETQTSLIHNKSQSSHGTLYYRSFMLDEAGDIFVVTFMNDEYSLQLTEMIASRLIYLQYGAFIILALVMAIWVTLLIKPLKQIKDYIDHIKEGKKGVLTIKRDDEIGAVAKALVEMEEELNRQNQIKEEMIHNISHDLKTPIALIESYAQSIKDDIYPYGDKNTSADIILENALRLEKKVKALLYLNRLDYLKDCKKEVTTLEMKPLIHKIVKQLSLLHPEIKIELDLDDSVFIGEEEHWRIAIENILQNAFRYVKETISIQLKNQSLILYNDGNHIDESVLETLFQPFVKGNKGEFGLGLYIVYKTVELYDYSIDVRNEEIGVSFIIEKKS